MPPKSLSIKITKDTDQTKPKLDSMSITVAKSLQALLESFESIAVATGQPEHCKIALFAGSVGVRMEMPEETYRKVMDPLIEPKAKISKDLKKGLKIIQNLFHANGLEYVAEGIDGTQSIDLTQRFKGPDAFRSSTGKRKVKNTTVVFHTKTLLEIGGKNPNIHLEDPELRPISCEKEQAMNLIDRLYKDVYVATLTTKKEDKVDSIKLIQAYPDQVMADEIATFYRQFETLPKVDRLTHLRTHLFNYLKHGDDVKGASVLRLFDHDEASGAAMRTILIVTKGYSRSQEITEIVDRIEGRLRFKLNGKLF